ncbi:hypothetical protein LOTGIDRAFT_109334, partial [Lottia gigantea]
LATSRSRRQKKEKTGRAAAFEKLKRAKERGEKHKYEIEEEKSVYEIVDEDNYSEIVRQRQEDDWIIDDDGAGYVEDGREIFDDDMDEETVSKNDKNIGDKKKNKNIVRPGTKPKANIKSMFAAASMVTKKKPEKDVSLADDELLGDLMEELGSSQAKPLPVKINKNKPSNKAALNPFSVKPLKPRNIKQEPDHSIQRPQAPAIKIKKQHKPEPVRIKKEPVEIKPEPVDEDSPMIEQFDTNMDDDDDVIQTENQVQQNGGANLEFVSSGWENVQSETVEPVGDIHVDSSKLPLVTNEEGEQIMRFYWLDAYEDPWKQPGTVYLFGKVFIESAESHVSCCVTVKNIDRRVYLLPRKNRYNMKTKEETEGEISMVDVYTEFNEQIADKHKIMKFKSMKVTKQYAFEKIEVPVESEYLEVRYAADLPALPTDLCGETFSHIFGANKSSLELFLIDRKLKGPGWLDLKTPQLPPGPVSWCKVEAVVTSPNHVTVLRDSLAPPPLVIMTLNLRTLPNPKTHQNEIIGAAGLIHNDYNMDKPAPKQNQFQQHFCVLSKPNDCIYPFDFKDKLSKEGKNMKTEVLPNERALLAFLLAKIHKIDPDLIIGHDIYGFDLDVMLHRINANKIPHWSKIGRLKRSVMPKLSHGPGQRSHGEKSAMCGRMMCDIQISAKELIRSRSYDLTELVQHILHEKRSEIDYDDIRNMYSSSKHLLQLIELTLVDSTFILRIMYELNIIPLALQITNICGNIMGRTLMGGRSERNEYLLLHAFTEKNFLVPDKEYKKKPVVHHNEDEEDLDTTKSKKSQGKRKPAYAGGLVLEPKKGFYDKFILLLDFNSLYPSIIQEYNICFTTINRTPVAQTNEEDEEALPELPDKDLEPGILPTEIRKLVESRKQVKQLMKVDNLSPEQKMQYDIRQKALKLTANSMYGCLGFSHSRFYAKPLAAMVTGKGREILLQTRDLVQMMNLDVIYGDTDSIMINTNSTDMDTVFKLGNKVKAEVNKLYRLLEIDIDGVFKSMLLLKKKKYAALSVSKNSDGTYTTTQELKGLDIVRRDWSDLAKEAGNFVVSQILSGESREEIVENIHTKLIEVGEQVRNDGISTELFHITKSLTKNPEDYPDKKSLPHVQVALRLNSKGGKKLRGGDTIPYIICEDGSNLPASQRAYHPEELAKQETLKIDVKYYLSNQVHPVVSRLCDPIEGTDAAHLAECLGLDPSGYRHAVHHNDEEDALLGDQLTEEERYKDCDRLKFICPQPTCNKEIIFDSVFSGSEAYIECSLAKCTNPACESRPVDYLGRIKNQLTMVIRQHIKKYYEGWMKCEDTACGARTKKLPLMFQRGHPFCSACHRGILHLEYSDSALYTQLSFYQYLFDPEKAMSLMSDRDRARLKIKEYISDYKYIKDSVDRWINSSSYSEVNLNRLFDGLFILK